MGCSVTVARRSLKPLRVGSNPTAPASASAPKIFYGAFFMLVCELKKILERLDDNAPISFEYVPRPHEYVVEPILGVRAEPSGAIIIGEKNFS